MAGRNAVADIPKRGSNSKSALTRRGAKLVPIGRLDARGHIQRRTIPLLSCLESTPMRAALEGCATRVIVRQAAQAGRSLEGEEALGRRPTLLSGLRSFLCVPEISFFRC